MLSLFFNNIFPKFFVRYFLLHISLYPPQLFTPYQLPFTTLHDQKLNGLLLFQFLLIFNYYFFMDMYKTFYPSWRPIIPRYIFFEDEGFFPLITKKLL